MLFVVLYFFNGQGDIRLTSNIVFDCPPDNFSIFNDMILFVHIWPKLGLLKLKSSFQFFFGSRMCKWNIAVTKEFGVYLTWKLQNDTFVGFSCSLCSMLGTACLFFYFVWTKCCLSFFDKRFMICIFTWYIHSKHFYFVKDNYNENCIVLLSLWMTK